MVYWVCNSCGREVTPNELVLRTAKRRRCLCGGEEVEWVGHLSGDRDGSAGGLATPDPSELTASDRRFLKAMRIGWE